MDRADRGHPFEAQQDRGGAVHHHLSADKAGAPAPGHQADPVGGGKAHHPGHIFSRGRGNDAGRMTDPFAARFAKIAIADLAHRGFGQLRGKFADQRFGHRVQHGSRHGAWRSFGHTTLQNPHKGRLAKTECCACDPAWDCLAPGTRVPQATVGRIRDGSARRVRGRSPWVGQEACAGQWRCCRCRDVQSRNHRTCRQETAPALPRRTSA